MAKENSVLLHGVALSDATVRVGNDNTPIRAMLYVRMVDRTRSDNGKDEIQYTTAFIYSGSPKVIEKMSEIAAGDLVDVYGTLTTARVPKNRKCPVCNSMNTAMGDVTYVSPLYVCRREHGLTQDEINQKLLERSEISNRVYAIGNICAGLEYNDKNGTGNPALRYQLAIPRTIRVHDDTANTETDYPWVLATGYQALEGKDALRIGSVVYLKGHLRSKEQIKEIQCSSCGNVFTSQDFPLMRISPHFTEYLHNCNFPDSTPTKSE